MYTTTSSVVTKKRAIHHPRSIVATLFTFHFGHLLEDSRFPVVIISPYYGGQVLRAERLRDAAVRSRQAHVSSERQQHSHYAGGLRHAGEQHTGGVHTDPPPGIPEREEVAAEIDEDVLGQKVENRGQKDRDRQRRQRLVQHSKQEQCAAKTL
ncbi:hypothetical protein ON010_g11103 [Phytophthora cinnamomi]|nr:hypothetical protein ON010_g11103 [Phytophthora cinnamomi]